MDFEPTTVLMDPGSPNPQPITVRRKSGCVNHVEFRHYQIGDPHEDEFILMEEIGDDPQWMLTSKLASTPEELAQATLTQGVALQAVRFKRPKAKCLIRIPSVTHEAGKLQCFVRYTMDGWKTFHDVPATHCSDCLGKMPKTDLYKADLPLPNTEYGTIEFAVCAKTDSQEYWDNNHTTNHTIRAIATQAY